MLAIVLGALAPAVAQVMVSQADRSGWHEVCTVSGMVWIKADAPASASGVSHEPGSPMAETSMNCPWCSLHGGAVGLPPVVGGAGPLMRQTGLPPPSFRAVTFSGVWAVAHARAPPLAT